MKPGLPAVELYACTDTDYPFCDRPAGKRCVNAKGKAVPPHPKRWNLGQGYADAFNKQQAKIDELNHGIDERNSIISSLTAGLKTITLERNGLQSDLASRDARIDQLEKLNAALQQRVDELTRVPPVPTDPPGWKPLVSDDFSGGLDLKVWDVKDKWAMGSRDDVSMAANVSVVDSKLRLWMRKESARASTGETRSITTGTVWLKQKLPAEYRLEYTISHLPQENGCWAGTCWATGSKSGAEIDSCESFPANKGFAKVTLHSRSYSGTGVNAHIMGGVTKRLPVGPIKVVEEHLLTGVKVWWNDVLVATYAPGSTGWDAAYWEDPAQVWQLWINLQSGGFGGKVDASTDWTETYMDIDSVRVWVPTA